MKNALKIIIIRKMKMKATRVSIPQLLEWLIFFKNLQCQGYTIEHSELSYVL